MKRNVAHVHRGLWPPWPVLARDDSSLEIGSALPLSGVAYMAYYQIKRYAMHTLPKAAWGLGTTDVSVFIGQHDLQRVPVVLTTSRAPASRLQTKRAEERRRGGGLGLRTCPAPSAL